MCWFLQLNTTKNIFTTYYYDRFTFFCNYMAVDSSYNSAVLTLVKHSWSTSCTCRPGSHIRLKMQMDDGKPFQCVAKHFLPQGSCCLPCELLKWFPVYVINTFLFHAPNLHTYSVLCVHRVMCCKMYGIPKNPTLNPHLIPLQSGLWISLKGISSH